MQTLVKGSNCSSVAYFFTLCLFSDSAVYYNLYLDQCVIFLKFIACVHKPPLNAHGDISRDASVLLQPCNYQLSKSIVHEIKFGDIAVM